MFSMVMWANLIRGILIIASTTCMSFSVEGDARNMDDNKPIDKMLIVAISKAADNTNYWMAVVKEDGNAELVVIKNAEGAFSTSETFFDQAAKINLNRSFVHLELKPLTIQVLETNAGGATRLTHEGKMIDGGNVITGVITNKKGDFIVCCRFKRAAVPTTQAALEAITYVDLLKLKQDGLLTIDVIVQAESSSEKSANRIIDP